jgi:hypothetical protein
MRLLRSQITPRRNQRSFTLDESGLTPMQFLQPNRRHRVFAVTSALLLSILTVFAGIAAAQTREVSHLATGHSLLAEPVPAIRGGDSVQVRALNGQPVLSFDATDPDFGTAPLGDSSDSQMTLLTNTGAVDRLIPSDGGDGDQFGWGISISGDTAVFGAPGASKRQGRAYVFARVDGVWTEQMKLTASDGAADDNFGTSVAISNDLVVVGAPGSTDSRGAAYVFILNQGVWTEQGKLTAADGELDDRLGESAAIESETALVGAPGVNGSSGAVYVFARIEDQWSERIKLEVPADEPEYFGKSVALQGDTMAIGAPYAASSDAPYQGAAYIFSRTGDVWSEQARLLASDGAAYDQFGWALDVSDTTLLIGAREGNELRGAAYVFTHDAEAWIEEAEFTVPETFPGSQFGHSVALSGDRALVGLGRQVVLGNSARGAAYIFNKSAGNWSQRATLTAADGGSNDQFGFALSLSGDSALVGVPEAEDHGAADVFAFDDTLTADLSPQSLSLALQEGQFETQVLTISNPLQTGGENLDWSVDEDGHYKSGNTFVNCNAEPGIMIHDDGSFEGGVGANAEVTELEMYVDRFTPSKYPAPITAICTSFAPFTTGNSLDFEIVAFDDDGPEGGPGTELAAISVLAAGIPAQHNEYPAWFSYDISSLGLSVESGSVFLGLRWVPEKDRNTFVGADTTAGTRPAGFAGGYVWFDNVGTWAPIEEAIQPEYRSLAMRAVGPVDCELPAWVGIDPVVGSVLPGDSEPIEVTFDSAGLAPGEYAANICLSSNASVELTVVPLSLTVTPVNVDDVFCNGFETAQIGKCGSTAE